jgi:hypothetical protein
MGLINFPAGTWRGESPCVAKDTACHDEKVAYRFTRDGKGTYSVSADKIVDGKLVNMTRTAALRTRPVAKQENWAFAPSFTCMPRTA